MENRMGKRKSTKGTGAGGSAADLAKEIEQLQKRLAERQAEEKKLAELQQRLAQEKPKAPALTAEETETLLEMAKASLQTYGTLVPPKEALYGVMTAVCPHCGQEKSLTADFGLKRLKSGKLKPQSWCRQCRNSPDSHPTRRRSR